MSRRVAVAVTARPSYSRIRTCLEVIRDSPDLELQLIAGASALLPRYGKIADQMLADGFEITSRVPMLVEGDDHLAAAKTTGSGIEAMAQTLYTLKPDVVVTVADRYETMTTAIAASYLHIPLCHVQGGEVTGSIDEKVRHAVTKLADMHCVANAGAQQRVVRMGEREDAVHVTGCPSIDLAKRVAEMPKLEKLPPGLGPEVNISKPYLVVMQHPVTTEWQEAKAQIQVTLEAVRGLKWPTIWFWPNVDAGSVAMSRVLQSAHMAGSTIQFRRNLPPEDFLRLLIQCNCLIGNSSVGIRECSYLGVPVVDIGSRQHGRAKGMNVIHARYNALDIDLAIRRQLRNGRYRPSDLYGTGEAGLKIAALLATEPLRVEKRITY